MSTLSQFVGCARVPKALVNATSSTGTAADDINADIVYGAKKVSSGSLTASTLATALSITGAGALDLFVCTGVDSTSRTHRIKCTVDGTVVYDATTAAVAALRKGVMLVGVGGTPTSVGAFPSYPIFFNTSLLIEYASSVTETAKTTFAYTYKTF